MHIIRSNDCFSTFLFCVVFELDLFCRCFGRRSPCRFEASCAGACFAGHEDKDFASSTNNWGDMWNSTLHNVKLVSSVAPGAPSSSLNLCVTRERGFLKSQDSQWIQQSFDAVFPPEAPLDRNAFPGVAKAWDTTGRVRMRNQLECGLIFEDTTEYNWIQLIQRETFETDRANAACAQLVLLRRVVRTLIEYVWNSMLDLCSDIQFDHNQCEIPQKSSERNRYKILDRLWLGGHWRAQGGASEGWKPGWKSILY